jgi:hypothetical protein
MLPGSYSLRRFALEKELKERNLVVDGKMILKSVLDELSVKILLMPLKIRTKRSLDHGFVKGLEFRE